MFHTDDSTRRVLLFFQDLERGVGGFLTGGRPTESQRQLIYHRGRVEMINLLLEAQGGS